jgi:hypothetical protein
MLADGAAYAAITTAVQCPPACITRWKQRFEASRIAAALEARYRGQPARVCTPALDAKILAKTQTAPPDGSEALDDAQGGPGDESEPHAGRASLASRRTATASP